MMRIVLTVLIIVLIVAAVAIFFLYRTGMKMQAEQAQSQKMLETYAQVVNLLVIDKKKMKFKEAPFPKEVFEQAPKRARFMKVYVVRGKVGPKIVDLMCDKDVFEDLPVKTTVKAKVSGMYLMQILQGAQPSEKTIEKRRKEREKAARKAAKG
jgi:hypothetical protein